MISGLLLQANAVPHEREASHGEPVQVAPGRVTGTALVMAGGTGGHIFPGLAVAEALRSRGWRVHWLGGAAGTMESQLVPPRGFAYESIAFGGVRGKGVKTLFFLPLKLLRAFWQSIGVVRRVKPDVVIGLGGYITFPAGMMAVLLGKPLVLHEQNSIAGMANRILAGVADRVKFYERDLFATSVKDATVVTVYLLPSAMGKVEKKLRAELAPGTRVEVLSPGASLTLR